MWKIGHPHFILDVQFWDFLVKFIRAIRKHNSTVVVFFKFSKLLANVFGSLVWGEVEVESKA